MTNRHPRPPRLARGSTPRAAWIVFLFVGAGAATVAACSLINTDDLAGDDDVSRIDASLAETGADAPRLDGATPDASVDDEMDASLDAERDAGRDLIDDAAADAPDAPDSNDAADASADAGPWCATHGSHTVCSDFDEGSLLIDFSATNIDWATPASAGDASIALDLDASFSAPGSLRTSLGGNDAAVDQQYAYLYVELPYGSAMHVEFDMLVDPSFSNQVGVGLMGIDENNTAQDGLAFGLDGFGTYIYTYQNVADGGPVGTQYRFQVIPLGAWTHVSLDEVRAATGSVTLAIDHGTPKTVSMPTRSSNATISLHIGVTPNTPVKNMPTSPASVHFDNVTIDETP